MGYVSEFGHSIGMREKKRGTERTGERRSEREIDRKTEIQRDREKKRSKQQRKEKSLVWKSNKMADNILGWT